MEIVSRPSNKTLRTIEFIIYCLKVVGLAPFSIRTRASIEYLRNTYTWVIEFSNVGLCYNIFITVLFPTTAAYLFRQVLSIDYLNKSSLTRATYIAQVIFLIGTSFVILISWTLNQKKATGIINRLLDVHNLLSSTKIPPSCRKTLILLSLHVIINVILWASMLARSSLISSFESFLIPTFTLLPSLVICWYVIEYSMIVGLVNAQLKSINKNLLYFKKIRNCFLTDLLGPHLEASSSPSSQLVALHSLQSHRTILFEIAQEIAEFFSFPILLCFAYFFFALVFNIYYLIIPFVAPNGVFTLFLFLNIVINWIVIIVYPIISLLFSVTETVNEAKLTGRMVHKLLVSSTNQEVKAKLRQFSLQLLHENLNYTACGFFTLDFTLLHMVLGSLTTYLVILIQFQRCEYKVLGEADILHFSIESSIAAMIAFSSTRGTFNQFFSG